MTVDLFALDAEAALLGAALLDPAAVPLVPEPDAFTTDAHRLVSRTVRALDARGEGVDPVTMVSELQSTGTLDSLREGALTVRDLAASVPSRKRADVRGQGSGGGRTP